MKNGVMALLVGLLSLTPTTGAMALSLMDYVGYSWEGGAFPPSNAGEELNIVATIDGISAPLTWDPPNNEYTIHTSQLISQGEEHPDPNNVVVHYAGGMLNIYEDAQFNSAPGQNPPNATAPDTYKDGSPYLTSVLSDFVIYYNTQYNSGAFEGDVTFTGGSNYDELGSQTTGYTFGGIFLFGVPPGYDLQWDGQILLDQVPVQASTWGSIKNVFLH